MGSNVSHYILSIIALIASIVTVMIIRESVPIVSLVIQIRVVKVEDHLIIR